MILEKETVSKFGHLPSSLAKMSHKKVCVICDYCQSSLVKTMKQITIGNTVIQKDACIKCKFKKREDISLATYGVKNSAQRKDIREKISEANSERLKSEEYKQQVRDSNLERYGFESAMQNQDIVDKQKATLVDRYGADNPSKIKKFKDTATKNMIKTRIATGTYQSYDGKTRPQLAKDRGFSRSHFGKLVTKYGFEVANAMTPHQSALEAFFDRWIEATGLKYEKQFRVQYKSDTGRYRIADFKIDNLLIELDGIYRHSERSQLADDYHKNKRQLYIDNGYTPLFFRENEVYKKFEIVKSMIFHHLNMDTKKVYARKCEISTIDKDFIKSNHLMGAGYGEIYALNYNGDPVAAIQIRRLKDKDYEISRFCSALNTQVVGGFSRLLKHVEKTLDMTSLKTFIDLRYGQGKYLSSFGFEEKQPYLSFKWTNGNLLFHRLKFPGNSGYDKGLFKIWDCGQLPFIKTY